MLSFILGLIPGLFNTVNGITNAISNERLKLIDAKTDQQKIASQERITSLQAKRDVMISESGSSKVNAIIRSMIAIGPAAYWFKIFMIDKVLGLGHTDALSPELQVVGTAVLGFYFLYEGAVNVTRIAKS